MLINIKLHYIKNLFLYYFCPINNTQTKPADGKLVQLTRDKREKKFTVLPLSNSKTAVFVAVRLLSKNDQNIADFR